MTNRKLGRIRTLAAPAEGQFGPDHTVVEVITPGEWVDADPFILLMDDRADGTLEAGPHPHAGFETVSFLVQGDMASEQQGQPRLGEGDVEWITTGSGIVHGPDSPPNGKMRMLQLWLNLPKRDRWTTPDHQFIRASEALVAKTKGAEVRLYSGRYGELTSPTRNRVPVNLTDVRLQPGASTVHSVPDSFNGFLYVLDGAVTVSGASLKVGQVGWLDRPDTTGTGEVEISNISGQPARVLFYAAERQNVPLAHYGPFVGDTRDDLVRSFERYKQGTFLRV